MRVIEYTITDPSLVGYGQRHRLLTSLLDPHEASAQELIALYHERWEIEIVQPQMTKTHLLTVAGGGDHVADLHTH